MSSGVPNPAPPTRFGYYVNTTNGHNKWWAYIWYNLDNSLTTFYGPLNSSRMNKSDKFLRELDLDLLIRSKLAKGYVPEDPANCRQAVRRLFGSLELAAPVPDLPSAPTAPAKVNAGGAALRRRRGA